MLCVYLNWRKLAGKWMYRAILWHDITFFIFDFLLFWKMIKLCFQPSSTSAVNTKGMRWKWYEIWDVTGDVLQ
jgi:hypothetical protein